MPILASIIFLFAVGVAHADHGSGSRYSVWKGAAKPGEEATSNKFLGYCNTGRECTLIRKADGGWGHTTYDYHLDKVRKGPGCSDRNGCPAND